MCAMDTLGIEPRTPRMRIGCDTTTPYAQCKPRPYGIIENTTQIMDTLGIEPRASRMLSGCDTTTPCARCCLVHGDLLLIGLLRVMNAVRVDSP